MRLLSKPAIWHERRLKAVVSSMRALGSSQGTAPASFPYRRPGPIGVSVPLLLPMRCENRITRQYGKPIPTLAKTPPSTTGRQVAPGPAGLGWPRRQPAAVGGRLPTRTWHAGGVAAGSGGDGEA